MFPCAGRPTGSYWTDATRVVDRERDGGDDPDGGRDKLYRAPTKKETMKKEAGLARPPLHGQERAEMPSMRGGVALFRGT